MNEDTLSTKRIDTNETVKFLKKEGQKVDKANKKYSDYVTNKKHAKALYKTMDTILTDIEYSLSQDAALEDNTKAHEEWLKDFYSEVSMSGLLTKPQVLKDMHSWENYYSDEWKYASANYPHIAKDLPKAIKDVENSPYYWFQGDTYDGDYVPEPVDDSEGEVDEVIENMIDEIKLPNARPCTVKDINKLTAFHNHLYNTAFGTPSDINNCMKHIIKIIDNLNGVPATDRLKYLHIISKHTAEQQLLHALKWSTKGQTARLAFELSQVANSQTNWFYEDIHKKPDWFTKNKVDYDKLTNSGVTHLISDIGADLIKTEPVKAIGHTQPIKKAKKAKDTKRTKTTATKKSDDLPY